MINFIGSSLLSNISSDVNENSSVTRLLEDAGTAIREAILEFLKMEFELSTTRNGNVGQLKSNRKMQPCFGLFQFS